VGRFYRKKYENVQMSNVQCVFSIFRSKEMCKKATRKMFGQNGYSFNPNVLNHTLGLKKSWTFFAWMLLQLAF